MALGEQDDLSEDLLWADDGAASGSEDGPSSEEPEQQPSRQDESSSRKHKGLDIAGTCVINMQFDL
jgi:hypothetical protein